MIIIGVDPGATTGVSTFTPHGFDTFESPAAKAVWDLWNDIDELHNLSAVVCERYVLTSRPHSVERDALYVSGAVKYRCELQAVRYVEYTASESKQVASDDKLKSVGLWTPGRRHVNDASRLVWTYLVREHPDFAQERLRRSRG